LLWVKSKLLKLNLQTNHTTQVIIEKRFNKFVYKKIILIVTMNKINQPIKILEEKIILLLNRLKENHLELVKSKDLQSSLVLENKILKEKILKLEDDNKSLKVANNLLGSSEGNSQTKTKINSLIKEVDYCIQQLSEMN